MAVYPAFGLRNQGVHRFCVGFYFFGNVQAVDDPLYIRRSGVVMAAVVMIVVMIVMVFMVMAVMMRMNVLGFFLFAVHGHLHVGARNAALDSLLRFHMHAGQAQAVHFFNESLFVGNQFQQRRHQHIARRAHGAFQIEGFHGVPPITSHSSR